MTSTSQAHGSNMDSAIVTAMAATLGSLVGASASVATTWLTQRTQRILANTEWRLRERQALYEAFITEASRMSVDALAHSLEKPDQLIALYGILSRIRLMSGDEVLRTAEDPPKPGLEHREDRRADGPGGGWSRFFRS